MPYIKVSPSALSSMSETLRNSSSKVGQIESDFSGVARKLDWDVRSASDIQRRMDRINGELEEQARMLSKMHTFIGNAKSKYEFVQGKYSGGSGASGGAGSSRGFSFGDQVKQSFDLGELGKKAIGAFGPIGSLAGAGIAIYEGSNGGDWEDTGKAIAEGMVSWAQHFNTHKWTNFNKANSFGYNWGTKSYAKRLLGLTCETSSRAAAWGNRIVRNFKSGFTETFVKFDPKAAGSGYKPNWFGIVGTVIDLSFNAYGNYKQVKNGEISADRAVVETVAETAANLLLVTAAGAIAAATLPATAPAVAVTIAGAGIMWAADGITKLITGGDKGIGELASEGVGWLYDKGKEAATKVVDYGKNITSKAVEKAANFFDDIRQRAIGTSNACCI